MIQEKLSIDHKKELSNYYDTILLPELRKLEDLRQLVFQKNTYKKLIPFGSVSIVVFLTSAIVLNWKFSSYLHKDFNIMAFFACLVTVMVYRFYIISLQKKEFFPIKFAYLNDVVGKMVDYIFPNAKLNPTEGISKDEFYDAGLFKRKLQYLSNDLISGSINRNAFKMAYVELFDTYEYKNTTTNRTISKKIHEFIGTFIKMEIQTYYSGKIYIKTKNNEATGTIVDISKEIIGTKATTLLTKKTIYDEYQLKNNEFNSYFSLACENSDDIQKLEMSKLIDVIIEFKKKTNFNFDICISNNNIIIALRKIYLNHLSLNKSIVESSDTKDYLFNLNDIKYFMTHVAELGNKI